jgi:hypothetical protein
MSVFGDILAGKRELREKRERQLADRHSILEHRLAMKAEIAEHLASLRERRDGTLPELIIRDFDRIDSYPQPDERFRGISPWFKVEARGQYHAGLEVLLKFENVIVKGDVARAVSDLDGSETVAVVGRIPYDSIVQIDWAGDEYYGQPHVYCSFDHGGEPFESVELYRPFGDHWSEHLDGVRFKDRGTRSWQLRRLWRDWRLHREMAREQKRFERETRPPPTSALGG